MTDSPSSSLLHLDEAERHGAADGTLAADRAATVAEHLDVCAECAADVARIRALVAYAKEAPSMPNDLEGLWPGIRARIDQTKVVALSGDEAHSVRRVSVKQMLWGTIGVAAVVVVAITALLLRASAPRSSSDEPASPSASFITIADSARLYEQEAQTLLNELELRRSMLRPEAAQTVDHDLKIIDSAIAELKDAIARDPRNVGLQRLLASSYRQKVELLKRANNAG
jgi:hypothetical protein